MKKTLIAALLTLAAISSCKMENPLLSESPLPYGAPQFDKIKTSHYMPAFRQALSEAKADIDAIVSCPDAPTFENTVEALERSGETLNRVASIFYNLKSADTNDDMQKIAEEVAPMMTEFEMYVSLNEKLFARVKEVYGKRDSLGLEQDRKRILEKSYKGFVRGGANLSPEDKAVYSKLEEELSLLTLKFAKNSLDATNAFKMNLTDSSEVAGLPQFVLDLGRSLAAENGQEGWTFDLSYPSYSSFTKYADRRDLREKIYMAYNTRAVGGDFDNTELCRQIVDTRLKIAKILGYETFADYAVEDRMVGSAENVHAFLKELRDPSVPAAKAEIAAIEAFAHSRGFEGSLQAWDLNYWSEKYKAAEYALDDAVLKPYLELNSVIDAVFGLATKLYGIRFEERSDIPVYHKDVRVYDVLDAEGAHKALFYCDFHPRASKRGGAWMTDFQGQYIDAAGVEHRPFVSIVCNLSRPTEDAPALLTHSELTTFLHEFGHSLHGMLAEGRYVSITGTNVDHDFVELPSQIMENFAFEKEWLQSFAKDYRTGDVIPDELISKILASRNFLAAYYQVRQLWFGTIDMAWYDRSELPAEGTLEFERIALKDLSVLPDVPGTSVSAAFHHIFDGGYMAGYYSYKWAEVLEADAFSLFEQKGIFNPEVSSSFRDNILSKGSLYDAAVLYRNFRGHDPEPKALLVKLGIISADKN